MVLFLIILATLDYLAVNERKVQWDEALKDVKLENQFGEQMSIRDFKGQVLLVDFWFAGCKPCLEEMKLFPSLLEKYDSKLAIMSVSIEPLDYVKRLLANKTAPWDFLIGDNPNWNFCADDRSRSGLVQPLGVIEYPTYLLFDKEGTYLGKPRSGVTAVEYEIGGLLDFGVSILKKARYDYIGIAMGVYTSFVLVILVLQGLLFLLKRQFR